VGKRVVPEPERATTEDTELHDDRSVGRNLGEDAVVAAQEALRFLHVAIVAAAVGVQD
jgi:hypothetical protein